MSSRCTIAILSHARLRRTPLSQSRFRSVTAHQVRLPAGVVVCKHRCLQLTCWAWTWSSSVPPHIMLSPSLKCFLGSGTDVTTPCTSLQVLRLFNLCDIGPAQQEADGAAATSSGGRPRSALPSPERSRPSSAREAAAAAAPSQNGGEAGARRDAVPDRVRSQSRDPSPIESAESG